MSPPRIVSLIASSTEIVCALGFERHLVGRSHECDFPASVRSLPVCTEPKFADGMSYQIDERIKAILQEGLSVYRVDAERLEALQPDLIVTQTQCDVCAVGLAEVEDAVCQWVGSSPRIVSLHPNGLEDIFSDIRQVAVAFGVGARGEALVEELRTKMKAVADRAASIEGRPTVACIDWIDPLMAAGNWMPDLVEMAGGHDLFGKTGEHAPRLDFDDLVAADPDVVVLTPCGFDVAPTLREVSPLTTRPKWSTLRAVAEGRVYVADGNQFFNRPGPRVVETLEIAAEMLHPEVFDFGHEGIGWQHLSRGNDGHS